MAHCGVQFESLENFDVFKLAELTGDRPLEAVTLALLHRYSLCDNLSLPLNKLSSYLQVGPLDLVLSQAACMLAHVENLHLIHWHTAKHLDSGSVPTSQPSHCCSQGLPTGMCT